MDSNENLILKGYEGRLDRFLSSTGQEKDYIENDEVRIYPPAILFTEAYDGKKFVNKLKIINAGKKTAFVRLLSPTSKVN